MNKPGNPNMTRIKDNNIERVRAYCHKYPYSTNKEVALALGMCAETVGRHKAALKEGAK